MWVYFGSFKWPSRIVNEAQESVMRNPRYYGWSLEEILHKFYGTYRRAI